MFRTFDVPANKWTQILSYCCPLSLDKNWVNETLVKPQIPWYDDINDNNEVIPGARTLFVHQFEESNVTNKKLHKLSLLKNHNIRDIRSHCESFIILAQELDMRDEDKKLIYDFENSVCKK